MVSAVPIVGLGLVSYRQAADFAEKQSSVGFAEAAEQVAAILAQRIIQAEMVAQFVATSEPIAQTLARAEVGYIDYADEIDDALGIQRLLSSVPLGNVSTSLRVFAPGDSLMTKERNTVFSLTDLPPSLLQEVAQSPFVWITSTDVGDLYQRSRRVLSVLRAIPAPTRDRRTLGVVAVDIDEVAISSALGATLRRDAKVVVYRDSVSMARWAPVEEGTRDVGADADDRQVEQTTNVFRRRVEAGSGEWTLLIEADADDLVPRPLGFVLSTIAAAAAFLVLSVVASMVLSRALTIRVTVLRRFLARTADGDYDRIEVIHGSDEVAQLQRQYNQMVDRIRDLVERVVEGRISRREAELKALQDQIKPHFLYNTIDTLRWIALRDGADRVADLADDLSRYFRLTLNSGVEITTVENEVEHVRTYVRIVNERLQGLIRLSVSGHDRFRRTPILKLLLQPIVENAVLHGLQPLSPRTGSLSVTLRLETGVLAIEVCDDGVGMTPELLAGVIGGRRGYGFRNVAERIRNRYGEEYGISVSSTQGVGTTVTLRVPVTEATNGDATAESSTISQEAPVSGTYLSRG